MRRAARWTAIAAAPLMAACATTHAPQATTISGTEFRQLSRDEAHERIVAQIGDLLVLGRPEVFPADAVPPGPLQALMLHTRAHASDAPGVCQRENVRIDFHPESGTEVNADTPMLAHAIQTWPAFHVRADAVSSTPEPIGPNRGLSPEEQRRLLNACQALPDRGVDFIVAQSAWDARKAVEIFGAVRAQVERDASIVTCQVGERCASVLAAIRGGRFSGAEQKTSAHGVETWWFSVGTELAQITIRRPALGAIEVVSIVVAEQFELTGTPIAP